MMGRKRRSVIYLGVLLSGIGGLAAAQQLSSPNAASADELRQMVSLNIPAQAIGDALNEFAAQAGLQVVLFTKAGDRINSPRLVGRDTRQRAAELLLGGTALRAEFIDSHTVAVRAADAAFVRNANESEPVRDSVPTNDGPTNSGQQDTGGELPPDNRQVTPSSTEQKHGIPEILVKGSRLLDMDIQRTRDDAQPYVIFDHDSIEQSGASSLEDFLKQKLPMNASAGTNAQTSASLGNLSQIDLRGLGSGQTLILIDGHRSASPNGAALGFGPLQSDINGLPLAAVERIEVLPTTASGIYGGSATGGVVNIVLRRNYNGATLEVKYDNTFGGDSPNRSVNASAGFNLADGKTNILLAGSYSWANPLAVDDRDFLQRGRAIIAAANPSFFYGGPYSIPLGATTNISSLDGSNLILKSGTSLNSPVAHVPVGYAGADGGQAFLNTAGSYNFNLANNAQLLGGGDRSLLNGPHIAAGTFTIRRQFNDNIQTFVELAASRNHGEFVANNIYPQSYVVSANARNNPFSQDIAVVAPFSGGDGTITSENLETRGVGGFVFRLPASWSGSVDYTWDRSRLIFSNLSSYTNGSETSLIADGSIDVLRDAPQHPLDISSFLGPVQSNAPLISTLQDATARLAGPIGDVRGGPVSMSVLFEHRREDFSQSSVSTPGFPEPVLFPAMGQVVNSAYAEVQIPFVSVLNGRAGLRGLDIQLAVRFDEYKLDGASLNASADQPAQHAANTLRSTNPTLGIKYQPLESIILRSSFGTGFLPPTVNQLVPSPFGSPLSFLSLVDPRRGNEPIVSGSILTGGNPSLRPEKSTTWSAGFVLEPAFLPDSRVSVDWTRIDKRDDIEAYPGGFQGIIAAESLFPGRITRAAPTPGDPFGVGPITQIDDTFVNLARARVDAVDAALDYKWSTNRFGTFLFSALGSWAPHYKTRVTPDSSTVENAGIAGSIASIPLKFRGNANLTWVDGRWKLNWATRYFWSYHVLQSTALAVMGAQDYRVPSQSYHDLTGSYTFQGVVLPGGFKEVEIQAGVRNIFNSVPPFDPTAAFSYYYSFLGDPRLRSYFISLKTSF